VTTEFFVRVVVPALAHEVQIEFTEYNGKRIRIVDFKGIAGVSTAVNLVTAWGRRGRLIRGPGGFEKAFGAEFHSVGDFCRGERTPFDGRSCQRNRSVGSPGQEKTHRPVTVNGMRAEEGKGIGVTGGKDGIDLRFNAWIAGCNRRCVLHGWALLRQVGGLHNVAKGGRQTSLTGMLT